MDFIPQIIGFIGLVFLVSSLQSNKKGMILFLQIFANLFYGFQYILLNSLSACLMSLVSLIRCIVFYFYDKKGKKDIPETTCYLLIIACIVIGIFSYTNILSVVPVLATILYTYGLWQKELKVFRRLSCLISALWITFNFSAGAYVVLLGSIFELVSCIIAIYRFDIKKKDIEVK